MFVTADDGVRLHMVIEGPTHGDAVLLMHSLGCDLSMWDAQAEVLAKRFRVLRFDARGHGASGTLEGEYDIARLARDALRVLDAANVRQAHICGISMGGVMAQWIGVHAGDRVKTLVLANTAARVGTREAWQSRRDTVLKEGLAAIADVLLARFFCDAFRAVSPATVEAFRRILLRTSPSGYASCCAALRDADLTGDLKRIAAPTLAIGGRLDVSTPVADLKALAAAIAGAQLLVLESAHLSNVEQPQAFARAVLQHLEVA